MTILITGGAGFLGSHLVDYFIEKGNDVKVIDNLSSDSMQNLERWKRNPNLDFNKADLLESNIVNIVNGCDIVYHLAANPEVRVSKAKPQNHFRQNIEGTFKLLEAVRKNEEVKKFIFTSTSTVYGEAELIPTPENYSPLKPISHYGASKLASEVLICSYASMYGFKSVTFRLANIIGHRSKHGVIYDFYNKLRKNPNQLEVLGDGSQSKSYLYVDDCIEGMVLGAEKSEACVETFNLGSEDRVDVLTIAYIMIEEMGLQDVDIKLTGGINGGRGWPGDVKLMQLDVSKLKELGWEPRFTSAEAVRTTVKSIVNHVI